MAVTTDGLNATHTDNSLHGADNAFALTASDVNYIESPETAGKQMITKGISLSASAAVSVVTASGHTRVIPAGQLAPGIIHPIRIKRLNSTGTGAVVVWGWF
jgi:hypothetical protein